MAPTTDPADVPTTTADEAASKPHASCSPASTAVSHAIPTMPPPPRIKPNLFAVIKPSPVRRPAGADATRQTGGMVGADPFVGRDEQLAELAAAADGARRGRSGIVRVAGGAGIGKTGLVQQASASAT